MDFMGGYPAGVYPAESHGVNREEEGYYPSVTGKIVPPFMFIARAGE
jgi:hypothetical protein